MNSKRENRKGCKIKSKKRFKFYSSSVAEGGTALFDLDFCIMKSAPLEVPI